MARRNEFKIDTSAATVRPYGENTNRLLDIGDLAKTLEARNKARLDMIVRRKDVEAAEIPTNNGPRFGFKIKGQKDPLRPTGVGLTQIANLTRIPLDHLRLAAAKYPDLAAEMFNRWWHDDDIVNRIGTAKPRKNKVHADSQRQLLRAFLPGILAEGTLRAVLSKGYRIIDNMDVAAIALDEMEKSKRDDVKMNGSLSEQRMSLNFVLQDMRAEINFPNKGKGHDLSIRVPCGAGLRVRNSDVGMASMVVVPTLMVMTCSNLLVSTEELTQIHIGSEYSDMDVLSQDTIRKMNASLFARMRDVIKTCLVQEKFQRIADLFAENAGWPIEHPEEAIQNITQKFAFSEETSKGILARFIEGSSEHGNNRFAMAQAITAQAHDYEETDYEKTVRLQEAGSEILRMAQATFAKYVDVSVK